MSARLGVNINDETAGALRAISERRGITVTEAVRRAVSVYRFVNDETTAGKTFHVVGPDGDSAEVVLV